MSQKNYENRNLYFSWILLHTKVNQVLHYLMCTLEISVIYAFKVSKKINIFYSLHRKQLGMFLFIIKKNHVYNALVYFGIKL